MHDEDRFARVNGHAGRVVGPPREVGAFDRPVQYPETVRVVVELPRDVYLAAGTAADAPAPTAMSALPVMRRSRGSPP